MAVPQINNFIANLIKHNGPAKTDRFYVQITPPIGLVMQVTNITRDLIYQCEATELPTTNLSPSDYRMIGPSRSLATLTTYNDLNLTFLCTNDFYEKAFFDAWMEFINPRNLGWDFRYKNEYVAPSIDIYQLTQTGESDNSEGDISYAVRLINAYPISAGPLALNWSEDTAHRLTVTFRYDNYKPTKTFQGLFDNVAGLKSDARVNVANDLQFFG